jgi:hypothetical protein
MSLPRLYNSIIRLYTNFKYVTLINNKLNYFPGIIKCENIHKYNTRPNAQSQRSSQMHNYVHQPVTSEINFSTMLL